MDTTEELISKAIAKTGSLSTPEKKERYEEMLTKVLSSNESLAKVCGFTPEILEAFYGCAQRLYTSGKYKDAGIIFNLLTYLNVNEYKYPMGSAACAHMLNNYAEAITYYTACAYLDFLNPLPNYHISDCYLKLNYPKLAIQNLDIAIMKAEGVPEYTKIKDKALLIKETIQKGKK